MSKSLHGQRQSNRFGLPTILLIESKILEIRLVTAISRTKFDIIPVLNLGQLDWLRGIPIRFFELRLYRFTLAEFWFSTAVVYALRPFTLTVSVFVLWKIGHTYPKVCLAKRFTFQVFKRLKAFLAVLCDECLKKLKNGDKWSMMLS